ncbi:MAG: hypothetical protein H6Q14_2364 [Bacteroidetes bacterium]|nr:hypothetical protein [Bacteroidota bacterium]
MFLIMPMFQNEKQKNYVKIFLPSNPSKPLVAKIYIIFYY